MNNNMKITVLGSGSSGGVPLVGSYWGECNPNNPKNIRTRVSILVEVDGKSILIDTSPELRIQAINNNFKTVDAVCWTHAHADHAHGIDDLRQFLWRRKSKLPVYGSKETMDILMYRFDYVFDQNNKYFTPGISSNIITNDNINVAGIPCTAIKQCHGKDETLGFKFKNFVYSTDVNKFPYESEKYLYNLDVWIIDCVRYEPHYSHAHFDLTMSWIKKFKPKKAYLTHLGAWLDYDELFSRCPENVEPAYDGLQINFT